MNIPFIGSIRTIGQTPGAKKFNAEFEDVIKKLMARGVDPTPDYIFDFIKTHPADYPFIISRINYGLEDHLKIYLHLWGKVRASVPRKATPEEQKLFEDKTVEEDPADPS